MDRGVWQATVHGKSWIQLMTNTFSFTVDSLCCIGEMNITLYSNYTSIKINFKKQKAALSMS